MPTLGELENRIHYTFKDISLLELALTHSSYVNEHAMGRTKCNERIEFLGDAVLELVSSDFIYAHYPEMPEGEMSKFRASLVCEPALASDARAVGLPAFLRLGRGEDLGGGRNRDSVVSDALESVIGAIYLDSGLEEASRFILEFVLNDPENKKLFHDAKTALQELVQAQGGSYPVYELLSEEGPDHEKCFRIGVRVNGKTLSEGTGRSKKAAEQQAAFSALKLLKGII